MYVKIVREGEDGDKMDKYQKKANEIIELVEDTIMASNPRLHKMKFKGDTLLYGEPYYDLEDEIAEMLKKEEMCKMIWTKEYGSIRLLKCITHDQIITDENGTMFDNRCVKKLIE